MSRPSTSGHVWRHLLDDELASNVDCMMQHNNTANTHRSLRALAIISTSTRWGGVVEGGGGGVCPLIRVCSLIRSNTVSVLTNSSRVY